MEAVKINFFPLALSEIRFPFSASKAKNFPSARLGLRRPVLHQKRFRFNSSANAREPRHIRVRSPELIARPKHCVVCRLSSGTRQWLWPVPVDRSQWGLFDPGYGSHLEKPNKFLDELIAEMAKLFLRTGVFPHRRAMK